MVNISILAEQLSQVIHEQMKEMFENLTRSNSSLNYEEFFKWV